MTKNKTKMISIRVSEDDYQLLKDKYDSHGSRSISALAREALYSIIGRPETKPVDLKTEVGMLHDKLTALQHEVARLNRIISDRVLTKTAG